MSRRDDYVRYNASSRGLARRARHIVKLYGDVGRMAHRRAMCRAYNRKRGLLLAGSFYEGLPDEVWRGHGVTETLAERRAREVPAVLPWLPAAPQTSRTRWLRAAPLTSRTASAG